MTCDCEPGICFCPPAWWDKEEPFTVGDRLASLTPLPWVPHSQFYTARPPKFDPGPFHHTGGHQGGTAYGVHFAGGRQQGKSSFAAFVEKVFAIFENAYQQVEDTISETWETLEGIAEVLAPPPPPRHGPVPVPHLQPACRDVPGTFPTIRLKLCDARTCLDKVIEVTLHKPP